MEHITPANIELFFLSFIRVLTMVVFIPIIGDKLVNMKVKILFAFFLTLLVFPITAYRYQYIGVFDKGIIGFVNYAFVEILLGLILGFLPFFIFTGFHFGGEIISLQMGLSMSKVVDPITERKISSMANIINIFTMIIFMLIKGHLFFIEAIHKTFVLIPIGSLNYHSLFGIFKIIISNFSNIFRIGVMVAAPVLITLFIIQVVLGIVSKTMPMINIFLVSVPLKILVGMFIVLLMINGLSEYFVIEFLKFKSIVMNLLERLI